GPVFPARLRADGTDADEPLAQYHIVRDQVAVHLEARAHLEDEPARPLEKRLIHVVAQPAETIIAVSKPRARDALEQVQNHLAIIESIQQRREPPEVQ